MKSKKPVPAPKITATVTYVSGNKHITMQIANTRLEDWVDKSVILTGLDCTDKTLRNLRDQKKIPCGKIGGRYRYYLPGILFILEQSAIS